MKKKKSLFNTILFSLLLGLSLLLDLFSRTIPGFADRYRQYIFHRLGSLYSRITGLFPFSVGEILIAAGILWLFLLAICLLFGNRLVRLVRRSGGAAGSEAKTAAAGEAKSTASPFSIRKTALEATARLLILIITVMSLNCFILYQASGLTLVRGSDSTLITDRNPGAFSDAANDEADSSSSSENTDKNSSLSESSADTKNASENYTLERLASLRDYLVSECNGRALSVPRDESGEVVFAGITNNDETGTGLVSAAVRTAIADEVITCMHSLSEDYPLLSGYYPHPKAMLASGLMSQMNMEGYYFPFSMEANYNKYMTVCNYAPCMAHELSHLKGYLREDDCNMLAFLACIRSDDPSVVYSGYLSVLYYVDNDFYYSIGKDAATYNTHEAISETVRSDNTYLVPEIKAQIEANSPLDTEKVTETTKTLTDATLKANGVRSGWNNYNEVVKLLLDWYVE